MKKDKQKQTNQLSNEVFNNEWARVTHNLRINISMEKLEARMYVFRCVIVWLFMLIQYIWKELLKCIDLCDKQISVN